MMVIGVGQEEENDILSLTRLSVKDDIEAVLRKIEYRRQGSIAGFKFLYRDEHGVWGVIRWDGKAHNIEPRGTLVIRL